MRLYLTLASALLSLALPAAYINGQVSEAQGADLLQFPSVPNNVPEVSNQSSLRVDNTFQARLWSFNFTKAPWPVVLQQFAKLADCPLTMQSQPTGDFTYLDNRQYTVAQAIDIFNDHLIPQGCVLIQRDDNMILLSVSEPIRDEYITFVSVDQIDLVGRNTLAGAAIPVSGIDVSRALEEVEAIKSPLGKVKPFTHTGRLLVIDTGTHLRRIRDLLMQTGFARRDMSSTVYQLHHAKSELVAKVIQEFLAAGAQDGGAAHSPIPSGSIHIASEATTNSLLLSGTDESVQIISQLIADLDRAPREVLMQALIVEVQLGNTKEAGVELGFQDSVLFDRSIVDSIQTINETSTAPNGVQTTNQSILSKVSTPGFNFNGPQLGNNANNPSSVGKQGLSNFGMGRENGGLGYGGLVLSMGSNSVNVLLRALDAKFDIDILSRPQVRTVENQEAFIQIGQQVPVVDGVSVNSVGSANPIVRQDKAGIILKATPRISPDGKVHVLVNTEKSAFNLAKGTGVPIFTDATSGRVIEAPVKDITTASTTVSVQSGQTIILGGMINNANNVVHRKVPFLGDIPLLGRLFRYDFDRYEKRELLVFLTPIVLDSEAVSYAVMNDEVARSRTTKVAAEELDRWQEYRNHLLVNASQPLDMNPSATCPTETAPESVVSEQSPPIVVGESSDPSLGTATSVPATRPRLPQWLKRKTNSSN